MKKNTIANIAIIILLTIAGFWFGSLFIHPGVEYTDNAQVRKDIVPVSSRVQGFVKEVRFVEFQKVCKGDTLVIIEDAEFQLRLAQAEANLQNALAGESAAGAGIATTSNNLLVTDAGIAEVKIQLANAESEYRRFEKLLAKGAVTQQQFDGVKTNYETLKAKVTTMERQKNTTSLVRDEQELRKKQSQTGIEVCRAALDLAKLNLSYTVIIAPCDGTTSAKNIQEGELLMPGMRLLTIVDDSQTWIIANFRESQIDGIRIGSEVDIEVDAFNGLKFKGEVVAIADATGAQYSNIAPDNATGNFVKIEQRIPVKIAFTDDNDPVLMSRLSSGMNVECKVRR